MNKQNNLIENVNKVNINPNEFTKENIELAKNAVNKSDDLVVEIYHFINKTLDKPSKTDIAVYRKAILNLLNNKNDEKFKYIYEIIAKSVYEEEEKKEKMRLELKNDLILNPNIFTISWEDINKNIRDQFLNAESIDPETIKASFIQEHQRLQELREKINKMMEMGIDVPVSKKDLEIHEKTFLKLTDLINIFMLENFQDIGAMVQQIEVFEKRYSLSEKTHNSVYLDANYKKITNLIKPQLPGDAANKSYVDEQMEILNNKINSLMKK